MRAALTETATGLVTNVIEYDSAGGYEPPEGCELHPTDEPVGPGHRWDGTAFIPPEPTPTPDPTAEQLQIRALQDAVDNLTLEVLMMGGGL